MKKKSYFHIQSIKLRKTEYTNLRGLVLYLPRIRYFINCICYRNVDNAETLPPYGKEMISL